LALAAPTFARWVHQVAGNGEVVNLFMDYETFGEHQWADTGIFNFMRALRYQILSHPDFEFSTPRELLEKHQPIGKLSFPDAVSRADIDRDLSAWLGNSLQDASAERIYRLEGIVKGLHDPDLLATCRKLQTSDHFYYMCTKRFSDGEVHKYFNPNPSPYDAHIIYNNGVSDFEETLLLRWRNNSAAPMHRPSRPPTPESICADVTPDSAEDTPMGVSV
jgi:alpha-amylase